MCALKHIQTAPDKRSMGLEFYWLKICPRGTGLVSFLEIPDLPSNSSSGQGNLKLWDCLTGEKKRKQKFLRVIRSLFEQIIQKSFLSPVKSYSECSSI